MTHLSGNRYFARALPVIGCRCKVCTSADRRSNRHLRRWSKRHGMRIVIDAGLIPLQMLRTGVRHLDAICGHTSTRTISADWTILGPFNFVDYPPAIHKVHIYAAPRARWMRTQVSTRLRAGQIPAFGDRSYTRSTPGSRSSGEVSRTRFEPPFPSASSHGFPRRAAGLTVSKPSRMPKQKKLRGVEVLVVNARCGWLSIRRIST